jgi:hypothetical protein
MPTDRNAERLPARSGPRGQGRAFRRGTTELSLALRAMADFSRAAVRVDRTDAGPARAALDGAGLAVAARVETTDDGKEVVEVEVLGSLDGEAQREVLDQVAAALTGAAIDVELHSHGVGFGGSANHRWCDVLVDGSPIGLRILTGPGRDTESELDAIADQLGVPRARLVVDIPDDVPPNT